MGFFSQEMDGTELHHETPEEIKERTMTPSDRIARANEEIRKRNAKAETNKELKAACDARGLAFTDHSDLTEFDRMKWCISNADNFSIGGKKAHFANFATREEALAFVERLTLNEDGTYTLDGESA